MPIYHDNDWMRADDKPRGAIVGRQRTRAAHQAWLDEQYIGRKITLREWRFQFDLLSLENADGSFPEIA